MSVFEQCVCPNLVELYYKNKLLCCVTNCATWLHRSFEFIVCKFGGKYEVSNCDTLAPYEYCIATREWEAWYPCCRHSHPCCTSSKHHGQDAMVAMVTMMITILLIIQCDAISWHFKTMALSDARGLQFKALLDQGLCRYPLNLPHATRWIYPILYRIHQRQHLHLNKTAFVAINRLPPALKQWWSHKQSNKHTTKNYSPSWKLNSNVSQLHYERTFQRRAIALVD